MPEEFPLIYRAYSLQAVRSILLPHGLLNAEGKVLIDRACMRRARHRRSVSVPTTTTPTTSTTTIGFQIVTFRIFD